MPKVNTSAVIVAAGTGSRMGADIKKQFMEILGVPVIIHTLRCFEACREINDIIIVTAKDDIEYMRNLVLKYKIKKVKNIVAGGETRAESVKNGLVFADKSDYVAIHDGARPCVTPEDIEKTLDAAKKHGAAFLGVKMTDTVKNVGTDGCVVNTVDRTPLWRAMTPQCFKTEIIVKAYENADCIAVTDDAQAAKLYGAKVCAVFGSCTNVKITTKDDLKTVEQYLLQK